MQDAIVGSRETDVLLLKMDFKDQAQTSNSKTFRNKIPEFSGRKVFSFCSKTNKESLEKRAQSPVENRARNGNCVLFWFGSGFKDPFSMEQVGGESVFDDVIFPKGPERANLIAKG